MRNKIFFLALIIFSQFYFSQSGILSKIDSLTTDTEVQNFIRSCSKTKEDYLSQFELKAIQDFNDNELSKKMRETADSLGITKSFYKGDFNHDGRTDLIFIGDDKSCRNLCEISTKVIFDLGNDYTSRNLQPNHSYSVIPKIERLNGKDFITVVFEQYSLISKPIIISKTLDYKFDDFVEYNLSPSVYSIQKIEYYTGTCFGTCPVFTLKINRNENSKFIAKSFNFIDKNNAKSADYFYENKDEGSFETKISFEKFSEIEEHLNYINFSNLKDHYSVNWTDDQTSTLFITYNNGEIKTIKDYGLVGTYGLKLLYKKLFDLRFNQDWKKVK